MSDEIPEAGLAGSLVLTGECEVIHGPAADDEKDEDES